MIEPPVLDALRAFLHLVEVGVHRSSHTRGTQKVERSSTQKVDGKTRSSTTAS